MPGARWKLFGFMSAVGEWMRHDPPPGELLIKVAEFGAILEQDPIAGAEIEHANFLFRVMPGTEHAGRIVSISFTVEGNEVRCQDVVCVLHPQPELMPPWPAVKHHRE